MVVAQFLQEFYRKVNEMLLYACGELYIPVWNQVAQKKAFGNNIWV